MPGSENAPVCAWAAAIGSSAKNRARGNERNSLVNTANTESAFGFLQA